MGCGVGAGRDGGGEGWGWGRDVWAVRGWGGAWMGRDVGGGGAWMGAGRSPRRASSSSLPVQFSVEWSVPLSCWSKSPFPLIGTMFGCTQQM